jgi:hypothetical protein
MRRDRAESLVSRELTAALVKHQSMHSPHEGHSVIREEFEELWEEVRAQKPDNARMVKEAAQVAAMGLRFLIDLCEETDDG